MRCRLTLQVALLCIIAWCLASTTAVHAQTAFETALAKKIDSLFSPGATTNIQPAAAEIFPDDAIQSVMTPSGWGGYGSYVFGGIGGDYPELYRQNKGDLITSIGACTGNPIKAVNVAVGVNMTDVHRLRDFSTNIIVSRKLFKGTSVSVGGLQLLANSSQSDAPGPTFYIAFSHAVQTVLSKTPGCSRLSYSIGIGTGRFLYKSPKDVEAGHGKYGTAVFGNISYEIFQHVNVIAEWSGMNLGFALGIRPFKNPLSLGLGVINITRYSGDKVNMAFTLGYPLSLNR